MEKHLKNVMGSVTVYKYMQTNVNKYLWFIWYETLPFPIHLFYQYNKWFKCSICLSFYIRTIGLLLFNGLFDMTHYYWWTVKLFEIQWMFLMLGLKNVCHFCWYNSIKDNGNNWECQLCKHPPLFVILWK